MEVLSKYQALKQKQEAKKAARKQALADIDAEFGDVDAEIDALRSELLSWMKANDTTFHADESGVIEVRRSRPKYDVVNDKNLVRWLYDNGYFDSLTFVKSDVNALAALDAIPDSIVNVIYDDELVVRLAE